jgi:hypothetical protein
VRVRGREEKEREREREREREDIYCRSKRFWQIESVEGAAAAAGLLEESLVFVAFICVLA